MYYVCFILSSRRRNTRFKCDWSSDVCSSDLVYDGDVPRAGLGFEAGGGRDQLGEHLSQRRQGSGEDVYVLVVFVDLDAQAVVLGLHADEPQLLDHRLRVGKALRKLRSERVTGPDLQRVEALLSLLPECVGDQAEVGGPVVGGLEDGSERAVALFGEGQSIEHGRIADAQPHLAQGDSDQVFGRSRIEVAKQTGEAIELLELAARAAGGGDRGQAPVHLDHGNRHFGRGLREALRGDANVARLAVQLPHLIFWNGVGGRDRGDEQPLAAADLDRFR